MRIPTATYRIQFRNGMTFDRAAALVPYLKRLGISHLYASPIFTATSGSTHGYDVTDANEIEPAIGGREGFDRMVKALKAEGLGLILDIVPNHMAASLENPWWRDVVENGEKSRYARHFDIDWSRRLTLPFLGDTFENVLAAGDLSVKPDPQTGRPALAYYETFYPLSPATYAGREQEVLALEDKAAIARLHDEQPYRLMSWRDAPRDLSYRRFFEITGLAGVRVEDSHVFDDAHRLILELVREGLVDGLRVDHVDGLADPKAYLERLRREAGPNCYITVEKILGEGEQIPSDWPISGTTGYEFIAALSDALVDGEKLDELRQAYHGFIGRTVDMQEELRHAKLLMANRNFAGEVSRLRTLVMAVAEAENATSISEDAVATALRELLIAFPVYRTYGNVQGLPPEGRDMLNEVLDKVRRQARPPQPVALNFLERILVSDVEVAANAFAYEFRARFQQLTGPLMAKSVEDTLFFRQHMLLALNEVGSEPLPREFSLDRFHDEMATRLARQPDGLSGTSTHDTKRGEDARARLYALTEAPEVWAKAVGRWQRMNAGSVGQLDDGPAPEPAVEWMLYQALAGAWPNDLDPGDVDGLKALEERFIPFVEKALREAKLRTDWGDSNKAYEKAVINYACNLLSEDNRAFRDDFVDTLRPFMRAGLVNSVSQTIIKLTAPGVPDIYQGSEGLDLSLVDPDNRREPDFARLEQQLSDRECPNSASEEDWRSGRLKQHVISSLLHLRQQVPSLFRKGTYIPLEASGSRSRNIIAFSRTESEDSLIVVVPRLVLDMVSDPSSPMTNNGWQGTDTRIELPDLLADRQYRNVCTGELSDLSRTIHIRGVFGTHPFAILAAT